GGLVVVAVQLTRVRAELDASGVWVVVELHRTRHAAVEDDGSVVPGAARRVEGDGQRRVGSGLHFDVLGPVGMTEDVVAERERCAGREVGKHVRGDVPERLLPYVEN